MIFISRNTTSLAIIPFVFCMTVFIFFFPVCVFFFLFSCLLVMLWSTTITYEEEIKNESPELAVFPPGLVSIITSFLVTSGSLHTLISTRKTRNNKNEKQDKQGKENKLETPTGLCLLVDPRSKKTTSLIVTCQTSHSIYRIVL